MNRQERQKMAGVMQEGKTTKHHKGHVLVCYTVPLSAFYPRITFHYNPLLLASSEDLTCPSSPPAAGYPFTTSTFS